MANDDRDKRRRKTPEIPGLYAYDVIRAQGDSPEAGYTRIEQDTVRVVTPEGRVLEIGIRQEWVVVRTVDSNAVRIEPVSSNQVRLSGGWYETPPRAMVDGVGFVGGVASIEGEDAARNGGAS